MPIISMFYGIIIRMYQIDNQHHNLPHFHAKYAEFELPFALMMVRFWQVNCPVNS